MLTVNHVWYNFEMSLAAEAELDEEMKTLFSVQKIVIRQAFQNPTAASFNLQPQYWLGAPPSDGGFSCKSTDPLSLVISGDYFLIQILSPDFKLSIL